MTYLDQNVAGKGVRYALVAGVFIARAATAVGDIVQVAEAGTTDDAAVSGGVNGSDTGTLANTIAVSANTGTGAHLSLCVLAAEAASAAGQAYRGYVEGYYVDAKVTTAGAAAVRIPLYPTTAGVLNATAAGIGSPMCGRLLAAVGGAQTATLTKVHFRGAPGGFAIGAGAT